MNTYLTAQRGYSANVSLTQTDRRAEYDLVASLTYRLRTTAMDAKNSYSAYVQALHDNRKLWNALAVDVADAGNGLPPTLRAQIFYLAEFTTLQTRKILQSGASVMPLLEINMAVLRG
ncbi:MAG: flagellar biosynthesis regulator FlaF, partial [Roseobacter sp.]